MTGRTRKRRLSSRDLTRILGVTSALAAPFDLMTMLGEVVAAARHVLGAERGSVWLHDPATDGLVLEVATGHGIAPALSVTQMQAMLRIAFRLGADLEAAFTRIKNRVAETLPADRFITAFIGILEPATHRLRLHTGDQGPVFHFQAATRSFAGHKPMSSPLGGMPLARLKPAITLEMAPATYWSCSRVASTNTAIVPASCLASSGSRTSSGTMRKRRWRTCSTGCWGRSTRSRGAPCRRTT